MSDKLGERTHEEIKADSQIGIEAQVTRETESGEHAERANANLRQAGHDFLVPGSFTQEHYRGSFAVHMYWSDILQAFTFVVQTCPVGAPEWLAGRAIAALRGDVMTHYGRQRQVNRAGF